MEVKTVTAEPRGATGSNKVRKVRAEGFTPGVLYGGGKPNQNIQMSSRVIEKMIHDAVHVVNVEIGGEKTTALVRAIQRDYLGDHIQHFDLVRISLNDQVRVKLPIEFVGTARGAAHGGLLEVQNGEVALLCRADAIPRLLEVDVSGLEVGDTVKFKDLQLPEGSTLVPNPEGIVVACRQARRAAALDAAAALKATGADTKPAVKK